MATSTIEPKLYCPFPPGEEREGWPTTFVAVMDYIRVEKERDELHEMLRNVRSAMITPITYREAYKAAMVVLVEFDDWPKRPADETFATLAPVCQFCGNELREPGTTLCPVKETHAVVNR